MKRERFLSHRVFICFTVACCFVVKAHAGTRRALLVGINEYKTSSPVNPNRDWRDLAGSINDVETIHELLVARFGFAAENIRTLTNGAATRAAIRSGLREHLVDPTQAGDVCVFFYAGHGSQVVNSKSAELDGKDETIVPADANRGEPDIRDKELAPVFNDILDKGAVLTVFFDSCHSTSLQRGLANSARFRSLRPDTTDVADANVDPRGRPEDRGALVFSAAQEFERAQEFDFNGVAHGIFSYALAKKLCQMPPDEPAEHVFASVKAQMNALGLWQQPILQGSPARKSSPLFGERVSGERVGTRVALRSVDAHGVCELEGGRAIGIHPGCELRRIARTESGVADPGDVRVRVESVQGLALCRARVIGGSSPHFESGDLFEITRWAAPDEAYLRVWVPGGELSRDAIVHVAREFAAVGSVPGVRWIADPTVVTPTHRMRWTGTTWKLDVGRREFDLGRQPTLDAIRPLLADPSQTGHEHAFFQQLPPPSDLARALTPDAMGTNVAVVFTETDVDAHYVLVGRFEYGELQYAWVQPGATQAMADTSAVLPVRTDWVRCHAGESIAASGADSLRDFAKRLMIVRGFQTMDAPPDDGLFPYRLAIENVATGGVDDRHVFFAGETFRLSLRADEKALAQGVQRRYVYVLALDSEANRTLLFPGDGINVDNLIPPKAGDAGPQTIVPLAGPPFVVQEPFGIDTFILLTTREPLPDPRVLAGAGVRKRGRGDAMQGGLPKLLASVANGKRGVGYVTHSDWSIQRRSVRTAASAVHE